MARVVIELPEKYHFSTRMTVRFDESRGSHLGNFNLVTFLNEAFMRFLTENGFTNLRVDGLAVINADLAIVYMSESFYRNILNIDLAVREYTQNGCEIVYRVTNESTGKEVARAKTGMLFFDVKKRQSAQVPEKFKMMFKAA